MREDRFKSILESPLVKAPFYEHKKPFVLGTGTNLYLHLKNPLDNIIILILDENDQIVSDIDILLPKNDKILNISLGEK